jgi:membrane-bound acyltransferase YfiQ involved in biofilm formation
MTKFLKKFLIVSVVLIQSYIVFLADYPVAHALVGAHIGLDCGKMYQKGVDMFMERKHIYNIVMFGTSMILVIMVLLKPRKTKSE